VNLTKSQSSPDLPQECDRCSEVKWAFLDGRWYTMDARHNHPRIGRIVMGRGRDAADVAMSTAFGIAKLARFEVVTQEQVQAGLPGTPSNIA
jgi:hypothetical protein